MNYFLGHKISLLLLFLFLTGFTVFAQQESNLRQKTITISSDTIQLDSLSIVPGSINIQGIPNSLYHIDYPNAKLILKIDTGLELKVSYRVFPINLTQKIAHRSLENKQLKKSINPYLYKPQDIFSTDIFDESSLQKGGSISRGINFGNTRDLSVSSDLNLQLSGKIQDVEIVAAITDNSIPIQPEGNTQQLQDFDKVFVQFSKNGQQLIAGDFQLLEQKDQFLRFNKKAQGLSYSGKFDNKKREDALQTNFSAALSRGKFARNIINGIEGNQGPYKLTGTENEQFIIILSGTEKVYLDGALLKRGMEHDYVIDYNTGEVTFTTRNLITKDKRIVIEFQYSDRNYGRTLFSFGNDFILSEKLKLTVNLYSEQDMKFQQLLQTLSPEDIELLSQSGDSLDFAITPHIDSVAYNNSQVLYEKKDSLVGAVLYTYYSQSNDATKAFYQLSFSNVGTKKGNYIQDKSTANGRVFSWVAPVNGVPQGNHEPVVKLVSPKQKQMATMALEYKKNDKNGFFVEVAGSNDNKNLFSDLHKEDDQGLGLLGKYKFARPIGNKDKAWEFAGEQSYQFISKNFSSIERFRSTEFERDWSVSSDLPEDNEHLIAMELKLNKNKQEKSKITSSYIDRGALYRGFKNDAKLDLKLWKGSQLIGSGSYLSSNGSINSSTFLRHKVSYLQNLKYLNVKLWEQQENKLSRLNANDSLLLSSFNDNFKIYGAQISNAQSELTLLTLDYSHRYDYLPKNNQMEVATTANDYGLTFQQQNKKQTVFFKINTTLRELSIADTTLSKATPENTLLNRLEFNFNAFKGMISSNSFYEIGTGNELKREFSYVQVNPGQGVYAWNDYNQDGVQQLNEFEISQFTDQANFIRVFLTTTEFVKTFTNQLNQSFNINPAKYFKRDKNWKKLLTRFSDQAFIRLDQKNTKENGSSFNLPFSGTVNDTSIISVNSSYRNTIYFNRSNPIFGLDYSVSDTRNKSLLINGFDARQLFLQTGNIRYTVFKIITLQLKLEQQDKIRSSELFSTDDFRVKSNVLEPKIQFQKSTKFRFVLQGAYKDKRNEEKYGGQTSIYQKIGFETTYAVPGKGRLSCTFDYINNNYKSTETKSSPVQFEMLEGLQVGTNYMWQLRYQQTFKNNLQANISYDGRSSPGTPVVHTAGVQVQLMF